MFLKCYKLVTCRSLSFRSRVIYVCIFLLIILLVKIYLFVGSDLHNKSKPVTKLAEHFCLPGNATEKSINKVIKAYNRLHLSYKETSEHGILLLHQRFSAMFNSFHRDNKLTKDLSSMHGDSERFMPRRYYWYLGHASRVMNSYNITKAENAKKGSQLKLLLQLSGPSETFDAVFKVKWYDVNETIPGPVYSGKDRHYAEVTAFYLSLILDVVRSPFAAVRDINLLKEIIPVADEKLLNTFQKKGDNICLYGVCLYCSSKDLVCANGKVMEGTLIYYVSQKYKLKKVRHPWQRTYKCGRHARWELDENYCLSVQKEIFYTQYRELLLDLVETSIFDFLIDNGDRHHYEYIETAKTPRLLLIDNGKSFGNANVDNIDILAPLYQCCMVRRSLWTQLLNVKGGQLSVWISKILAESKQPFKLPRAQLKALDRRLLTVFATITMCIENKGNSTFVD